MWLLKLSGHILFIIFTLKQLIETPTDSQEEAWNKQRQQGALIKPQTRKMFSFVVDAKPKRRKGLGCGM